MIKEKHVHKLRRHTYKTGNAVYFCALDCKFKIITSLALGKRTICWRCGEEFVMNEYSIRLAKPHCEKCHKPKSNRDEDRDIITLQVPVLPTKEDVMEAIRTQSSARDLRSRLMGVMHGNLAGQPDNEEDI